MSTEGVRVDDGAMIGRILANKYEIERQIGLGSMGAVYRARHLTLDKAVCVKVMLEQYVENANLAQRFQREARAASRLDHPCSLQVLDYGREADGTLYIAMELIEGRDLFELVCEGAFETERVVNIMTQILSALAAAHDVGVLHRDLKPENIMVTTVRADDGGLEERVKVCDFGVAQIADPSSSARRLTGEGTLIGTPHYMSPEQARAEKLDARSDLYSAGVIMFQLLTGHLPFDGENPITVVLKHVDELPPRPRDLNPDVDEALEAICLRALEKSPDARWASAREMRGAIREAFGGRASKPSMFSLPVKRAAERDSSTPFPLVVERTTSTFDLPPPLALQLDPRPERSRPLRTIARMLAAAAIIAAVAGAGFVRKERIGAFAFDVAAATSASLDHASPIEPAEEPVPLPSIRAAIVEPTFPRAEIVTVPPPSPPAPPPVVLPAQPKRDLRPATVRSSSPSRAAELSPAPAEDVPSPETRSEATLE